MAQYWRGPNKSGGTVSVILNGIVYATGQACLQVHAAWPITCNIAVETAIWWCHVSRNLCRHAALSHGGHYWQCCWARSFRSPVRVGTGQRLSCSPCRESLALFLSKLHTHKYMNNVNALVQWSEDVIKGDPFFGRSRARFRLRPWVSNTIACDHIA